MESTQAENTYVVGREARRAASLIRGLETPQTPDVIIHDIDTVLAWLCRVKEQVLAVEAEARK